ncbi:MAG: hypothetical protein LQ340_004899 [Diploschistes diacapsis]|nr:MAG: hypothetical protein LQ340_004899 [Diploschistes diacapsis]
MRCTQCGWSVTNALQRLFRLRAQSPRSFLSKPTGQRNVAQIAFQTRNWSSASQSADRPAATTSIPPRRFGPAILGRNLRDEEIQSRQIRIVQEGGGISEPQDTRRVLRSIDRKEHFLVQVAPSEKDEIPVCKIMDKKSVFEREREKHRVNKSAEHGSKTIELSWRMAEGDFNHRMKALEQFLAQGRKVEILIAPKRKKHIIPEPEAALFLSKLRARFEEIPGLKETQPLSGDVGKLVTLHVESPENVETRIKAKPEKPRKRKTGTADIPWKYNSEDMETAERRIRTLLDEGKDVDLVIRFKGMLHPITEEKAQEALDAIVKRMKMIPSLKETDERKGKLGETMILHYANGKGKYRFTDAPVTAQVQALRNTAFSRVRKVSHFRFGEDDGKKQRMMN